MVEGDRETIELPVPFNLKALYFPFSLSLSFSLYSISRTVSPLCSEVQEKLEDETKLDAAESSFRRSFLCRFEREREKEGVEKTERVEKKLQFFADQPRLCEVRVKAAPFEP